MENNYILADPFITLMKRASRSKFSRLILNNRMLMQCYNVDIDTEDGFHYILHIPNTDKYRDEFYDQTLILSPKEILGVYNAGHKQIYGYMKSIGGRSKYIKEYLVFIPGKHGTASLQFIYTYEDDIKYTSTVSTVQWPVDNANADIANIERVYNLLVDRIRVGGSGMVLDGLRYNLQNRAFSSPDVIVFDVLMHKRIIHLPVIRSMFNQMKTLDRFMISIQETILPDVYVYSILLDKNGISEQLWGYVLNYK